MGALLDHRGAEKRHEEGSVSPAQHPLPFPTAYHPHRREYYERINHLVQQYLYIDRLLDSSLPHDLLNEYNDMPVSAFRGGVEIPDTISEERQPSTQSELSKPHNKIKRTPKDIYRRPTETTPLFSRSNEAWEDDDDYGTRVEVDEAGPEIPWLEDEQVDAHAPIVLYLVYVNFAANLILLVGKLIVVLSVPSGKSPLALDVR